jgi:hypothetical protein
MQLVVASNGVIRCVYDETLELSNLGLMTIRRGSHVEPDLAGNWLVDLAPVDGPRLGPFAKRTAALSAEVAWLEEDWLVRSEPSN